MSLGLLGEADRLGGGAAAGQPWAVFAQPKEPRDSPAAKNSSVHSYPDRSSRGGWCVGENKSEGPILYSA